MTTTLKPLLTSLLIFTGAPLLAGEVPQAGSNPISLTTTAQIDNVHYLMAAAAKRPDTTYVQNYDLPKHAWLNSFDYGETLEWSVSVEQSTSFDITALVSSRTGEKFKLEVDGNSTIFEIGHSGWSREDAGSIVVPAGTHQLKLSRLGRNGSASIKSLELVKTSEKPQRDARIQALKSSTAKFSNQDYGVMFQYGAWTYPPTGPKKTLEQQANDFDVTAFAEMVESTGAKYVVWSATWWTYQMHAPNQALDNILGHSEDTATRDLFKDIATELDKHNIDFYFYYHSGHFGGQSNARPWWQAQQWPEEFTTTGTGDRSVFFDNWVNVVSEMGNRYGSLLDGWFFDDGLIYYPAPFERLGAAAKAGNPDRLISYNPWIAPHYTDFEDLSFGEECKVHGAEEGGTGLYTSGSDKGVYGHCMITMEPGWGIYHQNQKIGPTKYSVEAAYDLVKSYHDKKTPISFNMLIFEDGSVSNTSLSVLQQLKAKLEAEQTVDCSFGCNTLNDTHSSITYSGDWKVSNNRRAGDYQDNVAWASANNSSATLNFTGTGVKVYMPTSVDQGDVEVFIDGQSQGVVSAKQAGYNPQTPLFQINNLSASEHELKLVKLNGHYLILDKFEVQNQITTLNDDSSEISYSGNWANSSNRNADDINDDVTYTTKNGDYAELTFSGTAVSVIVPKNRAYGNVEVIINGVSQGLVSAYTPTGYSPAEAIFTKEDLPEGNHTIRLVKRSGSFFPLDAIKLVVK